MQLLLKFVYLKLDIFLENSRMSFVVLSGGFAMFGYYVSICSFLRFALFCFVYNSIQVL